MLPQSVAVADTKNFLQHSQHSHLIPCEAPLLPPNANLEHFVTGYYGVYLLPGHTLQKHFKVIQTDLTPYIRYVRDGLFVDRVQRVVYGCREVDDVMLAAIRSDPGVEVVWRDGNPVVEIEEPATSEFFDFVGWASP
jgi:hypothetical protein